ncbi:MAG TPA: hypothetical protein V6D16_14250, partial [Candidatus Obscuribacterales bacterium]
FHKRDLSPLRPKQTKQKLSTRCSWNTNYPVKHFPPKQPASTQTISAQGIGAAQFGMTLRGKASLFRTLVLKYFY